MTLLRGRRAAVLLGAALLAALLLLAVLTRPGSSGALDPGSAAPAGSRALAALLEDRGVQVDVVALPDEAARAGRGETVLVPFPGLLTPEELDTLADGDAIVVLVAPDPLALEALGGGLEETAPLPVEPRRPSCDLEQAAVAGVVEIGGATYSAPDRTALGCYAGSGRTPLLALPDRGLVLLGTAAPLTNAELATEGAAALALGLLGTGDRVLWLLPDPTRTLDGSGQRPLTELLPEWVLPATAQLGVAALVLALWRGRQLGRPVTEPLPVVVRSAEAVEGRARLYRAARARDRAAEALRAAARSRLTRRLGLPGGAGPGGAGSSGAGPGGAGPGGAGPDGSRVALVSAAAERSGREAADVDALLFGPPPRDDAVLVDLAGALDALEAAVSAPAPAGDVREGADRAAGVGSTA